MEHYALQKFRELLLRILTVIVKQDALSLHYFVSFYYESLFLNGKRPQVVILHDNDGIQI